MISERLEVCPWALVRCQCRSFLELDGGRGLIDGERGAQVPFGGQQGITTATLANGEVRTHVLVNVP